MPCSLSNPLQRVAMSYPAEPGYPVKPPPNQSQAANSDYPGNTPVSQPHSPRAVQLVHIHQSPIPESAVAPGVYPPGPGGVYPAVPPPAYDEPNAPVYVEMSPRGGSRYPPQYDLEPQYNQYYPQPNHPQPSYPPQNYPPQNYPQPNYPPQNYPQPQPNLGYPPQATYPPPRTVEYAPSPGYGYGYPPRQPQPSRQPQVRYSQQSSSGYPGNVIVVETHVVGTNQPHPQPRIESVPINKRSVSPSGSLIFGSAV